MTGFSSEELTGEKAPFSYWAEEEWQETTRRLEEAFDGVEGDYEQIFKRKNGQRFKALVSTRRMVDADGQVLFTAIIKDVTEFRNAREEIERQNDFLNSVLESLNHPFYVINTDDYNIRVANSAARAYLLKAGATCYEAIHGRDILTSILPDQSYFSEIETGPGEVIIRGEAGDTAAVVGYAAALEESGQFSDVRIADIEIVSNEETGDDSKVVFAIVITR